ncbi:hypothetical protein [Actinomyces oricola]
MSARAGRWDLLEYNSDPVPGCPERVRAGAQRYVETAEEIRIAATNLRSISYDQKSKAINKIREQARSIAAELDKAHSRCDGAGGALGTFAGVLERSREKTKQALDQASAADSEWRRSVSLQNEAAEAYNATTDEAIRQERRSTYYHRLEDAKNASARLAEARRRAKAAVSEFRAAGAKTARELGDIKKSSPLNDSVLDRIKEVINAVKKWLGGAAAKIGAAIRSFMAWTAGLGAVCSRILGPVFGNLLILYALVNLLSPLGLIIGDIVRSYEIQRVIEELFPRDADNTEPAEGCREKKERHEDLTSMIESLGNMDRDDGLQLEEIECADGVTRYVLYIGGTFAGAGRYSDSMGAFENVPSYLGFETATDVRIRRLLESKVMPKGSEIMVNAYSQGALHGLHLINSGKFNITQMVTVDAPDRALPINTHGANILNLKDKQDYVIGNIQGLSHFNGDDFCGDSNRKGEPLFGAHADSDAHKIIAQQFSASTDPAYNKHRQEIAKYIGPGTKVKGKYD